MSLPVLEIARVPTLCLPLWTSSCIPPLCCLAHQPLPPLLMQCLQPALAFKPLILLLPASCLPLHPHHRIMLLAVFLYLLLLLSAETIRILQWNAEGLRARSVELLHFILSHHVYFICNQEFNLNPSSSFQIPRFLLCHLIAPTPSLAFFFQLPRTLAMTFISPGQAYPLNFLPPLFA